MDVTASADATATNDRQICAILAAQVAALRDRIDPGIEVELLWRTVDALSAMSELLSSLARGQATSDIATNRRCAAAIATSKDLEVTLEAVALQQSQSHDLVRQMAECVQNALQRLAMPMGCEARLSPSDLASTYVCEEQRSVHAGMGLEVASPDAAREP